MDEQAQQEINEKEWSLGENWRWGIFYFSELDSRVWVPKRRLYGRQRSGGTFNLAKPSARRFLFSFIGFLLVVLVFAALGSGR